MVVDGEIPPVKHPPENPPEKPPGGFHTEDFIFIFHTLGKFLTRPSYDFLPKGQTFWPKVPKTAIFGLFLLPFS